MLVDTYFHALKGPKEKTSRYSNKHTLSADLGF